MVYPEFKQEDISHPIINRVALDKYVDSLARERTDPEDEEKLRALDNAYDNQDLHCVTEDLGVDKRSALEEQMGIRPGSYQIYSLNELIFD
jgi:hypothetical protein